MGRRLGFLRPRVYQTDDAGSGDLLRAFEPSGSAQRFDRSYTSILHGTGGWLEQNRSGGTFSIQSVSGAPEGATLAGDMLYPVDFTSGTEPGYSNFTIPSSGGPWRSLYLSFWWWCSANWVGEASGVGKIIHAWCDDVGKRFYISAQGAGSSALSLQVRLEGIPTHGGARNLTANLATATLVRDTWHRITVLAQHGDDGVQNGTCDFWLDGTAVGAYSDIQWVAAGAPRTWTITEWAPTLGGGNGLTLTAAQRQRISRWYCSVKAA